MHGLIVDRMTVDARLPRHNNAHIDQLQAALTHWAEHSLHGISDSLSARIIPALTVNLGKIPEKNLLTELCTRLDRALTEALARLVPEPDAEQRREQLARWLQHGTPLWTQPTLCRTALGALLYAELRRPDGIAWLTPLLARQAARARLLHLPAPLLEAILAQMEDHPASAEQSTAERLSKVLQSWDDALPRTGQERGHWQQLLRQIERGLEQEKYDGWLEDLMLALARHGAPPGLSHKLQALIRGSRLPCEPDSLRARHVCSAWRSGDTLPSNPQLSARLQQIFASWAQLQPLALQLAQSTLPPEDLNAALALWLADALRLLPGEAKSWPRSRGDALLRLRARLHELKPEQREQTIRQLAAQLHIRLTQSADARAISDLDWLPRLLASPRLPARLADYIERFLADAAPSAAWRRKLARQLRLWSEDRSNPDDFSWENEARAQLAQWQSRLKTLPPSAIQSAALRACALAPLADRKQLAAAFYALEKLVPTLLNAYPTLATSPHLLAQLRRHRLKLWRGSVADWLPLADTLAAQTANPDGLPGLWPDILQQTPEQISQTLADQHDPSLARLWQASRAAQRPLRGEERHQWQSVAAEIQQQLVQNQLGDDSRFLSEDAGMVLLWPFLPELFSRCGWTTANGRWQSPEAQLKAWRALATLAGRSEDDEQGHSTRMLVGLEIDEPVAHAPQLSESEFEHLITASAAIKNAWASAISPMPFRTGLRPLFLRRNGIWRTSQSGWQITVQTAAQDILLAKLPWSLSIIMLPWLDQLITIDWPRPSLPHSPTAAES